MTIAVLGCGSIGQRRVRDLFALGERGIVAYDPDPDRRAAAAALGARAVDRAEDALGRAPDAAFVCTPPSDHLDGIRRSLGAGAHVFVEKPLADRLDGVADVLAEAERADRHVAVGYSLRSQRDLGAAKALVDGGRIGVVLHMRAEFGQYLPDWRPGRDYRRGYNASARMGGGVLLDQSHEVDYVRWFLGEPGSVRAVAAKVSDLEIDVEDVAIVLLTFAGPRVATIQVDSVRRDYTRSCTIVGSRGTLVWSLTEGLRVYDAERRAWEAHAPAPDANDMYVSEVRHFLEVVHGSALPIVTGRDALRTLEVVLAARRSAADGREIDLSNAAGARTRQAVPRRYA